MVTIQYMNIVDEWIYLKYMALSPLLVGLLTQISNHFGSIMELVGSSKVGVELSELVEECVLIFDDFLREEKFELFHEFSLVEVELKPIVVLDALIGVDVGVDE